MPLFRTNRDLPQMPFLAKGADKLPPSSKQNQGGRTYSADLKHLQYLGKSETKLWDMTGRSQRLYQVVSMRFMQLPENLNKTQRMTAIAQPGEMILKIVGVGEVKTAPASEERVDMDWEPGSRRMLALPLMAAME